MNALLSAPNGQSIASRDLVDELTGIRNRRGFADGANALLEVCRQARQPVALLDIEIVDYQRSVRSHGHWHGEGLLRATAGLIDGISRADGLAGRTGVDPLTADQVGRRLRQAAAESTARSRRGPLSREALVLAISVRSVGDDEVFD